MRRRMRSSDVFILTVLSVIFILAVMAVVSVLT